MTSDRAVAGGIRTTDGGWSGRAGAWTMGRTTDGGWPRGRGCGRGQRIRTTDGGRLGRGGRGRGCGCQRIGTMGVGYVEGSWGVRSLAGDRKPRLVLHPPETAVSQSSLRPQPKMLVKKTRCYDFVVQRASEASRSYTHLLHKYHCHTAEKGLAFCTLQSSASKAEPVCHPA